MPQGLQCFNSSGTMILDVTDRLTKMLGSFTTGTVAGSLTDANIANGVFWYVMNPYVAGGNYNFLEKQWLITCSGTTISWTPMNDPDGGSRLSALNAFVHYGIY